MAARRTRSFDAYRGLSCWCSLRQDSTFRWRATARFLLAEIARQFEHTPWGVWDLIMPAFMFMVGRDAAIYAAAKGRRTARASDA